MSRQKQVPTLRIASLFAGAGGLDRGFHNAGFDVVWANEFDKHIWATYERNSPRTVLDKRSITKIQGTEVPVVDGLIGGPPCQSWSEAGSSRGIHDSRGQLFFEYLRILEAVQPKFFLAENVTGLLFSKHRSAVENIFSMFAELGFNVSYGILNANNYGVPQDRERVIIVGYRSDLGIHFMPPKEPGRNSKKPTLRDAIWDLRSSAKCARDGKYANRRLAIPNHEYLLSSYSSMYMSRNRVRGWDEPSFTIQAGGRHAPIHPKAPKMIRVEKDVHIFSPGSESRYRRLSVREAARIQSFPDDFIFEYEQVNHGYKMIGNAVPVKFAEALARQISKDLLLNNSVSRNSRSPGEVVSFDELNLRS